jgi:hypothetical protein
MKRIVVAIAAVLLAAAPVTAATPNVGQHIHVEVSNHPVDGFPIGRAPYTFHVTIRLHSMAGKVQYLRIDDSSTTRATVKFDPPLACATDDCSFPFDWTVDFSSWSTGRHELRWHADSKDSDPGTSGTQRQYTTSRNQVCLDSCSPNVGGRKAGWHGGGSWYTGPGYVVALMTSPDTEVRPGGTVAVRSQYGNHVCTYLNPDFHHGSHGTALGCGTTVTIPANASVGDKLVIVADGAQEAGVLQLVLGDGTPQPTAFYGFQSWWARTGLVMP